MKSINLSEWAVKNQVIVLFFIIAAAIGGYFSYSQLSQKEDPDFPFSTMLVGAAWPGATAEEVQKQIVERLEKNLQSIPYLQDIKSYARPGKGVVYVQLAEGTSKSQSNEAWYQVRKKIADMKNELPPGTIGPFFNDEFGDIYGSIFAITGDGFSYAQLKKYAELLRQELLALPYIAKVNIFGEQKQKIYIDFSHIKMATLGLDPQLLIDSIRDQNSMQSSGLIRSEKKEIYLRPNGNFDTVESIKNLNIHTPNGDFRLADLANIYKGYEDPPHFKLHYKGQPAIGIAVSMTSSGNVIELGKLISKSIEHIQSTLPVGVNIHQISDQPQVVQEAIHGFIRSLLEAVVIILAISFISLGLRAGLVVTLSIPLVLLISFIIMFFCNIDLQRVSLGAMIIAMGLLVDDAMISVEMMLKKMEEGMNRLQAVCFAYTSTAFPMLTGTLITIAGFMPVGLAKSDAGQYTFSLFAVVTITLSVSWIVAVIFSPYFGYHLLKVEKHHQPEEHSSSRIRTLVENCLKYKVTVILLSLIIFLVSLFCFRFVAHQFFPPSERPEIIVDLTLPEGTSFAQTAKEIGRLERYLNTEPDIKYFSGYIGGNTPRFYLALNIEEPNPNVAQIVVMSKNAEVRNKLAEKIRTILSQKFPNVRSRVSYLSNGKPTSYPIQFRITGKEPATISEIADKVENIIRANPHTLDVHNDWQKILNERLIIDTDKSRALGLSWQKFTTNLQAVVNGFSITKYREADELIDVDIRGTPNERSNLTSMRDINIYTNNNRYVPLENIAKLVPGEEEGIIRTFNGLPSITVLADSDGTVQALDLAQNLNKELNTLRQKLPVGYNIKIAGLAETNSNSVNSILKVLPFAVFIMIALLVIQLRSFSRVIMVLITAPLGLVGVTATLLLFQLPFGFVAMLGVLSLSGMIMRNSVILIDQIEINISNNMAPEQAIIQATVDRFRPIMLTAAAAILAMIPLLKSIFWAPMAAAIMGGLFVATLLTIFFLPALYAWWIRA